MFGFFVEGAAASRTMNTEGLRSAFLSRGAIVEQAQGHRAPSEEVSELKYHFDKVLKFLEKNSEASVEISISRLEDSLGIRFSAAGYDRVRNYLNAQRRSKCLLLEEYRNRGRFPVNENSSGSEIPIFIDRFGTACAVGYLMQQSGLEDVADNIARARNNVYVGDIENESVENWVLMSGITIEEAALIQPGYGPVGTTHEGYLERGESPGVFGGIQLSDMQLQFEPSPENEDLSANELGGIYLSFAYTAYTDPWYANYTPGGLGVIADTGQYIAVGQGDILTGEGSGKLTYAMTISGRLGNGGDYRGLIEGFALKSDYGLVRLPRDSDGSVKITSSVYTLKGDLIGEISLDSNNEQSVTAFGELEDEGIIYFTPRPGIRVVTEVELKNVSKSALGGFAFGARSRFAEEQKLDTVTEMTGKKSGFIRVNSLTGFNYFLQRSATLEGPYSEIGEKAGTGETIEFTFDETGDDSDSGFFRVMSSPIDDSENGAE